MKTYTRVLNAFIYHRLCTFKGVMKLFLFMFFGLSLLLSILPSLTAHGNGNSTTSFSFASTGLIVLIITFSIISGSLASNISMEGMFIFPCKRSIYVLGNMITWFIISVFGIIMVGFFQSVSLLIGKILSNVKGDYIYLTDMTFSSYILGMVGALFLIMIITSLVFLVSVAFHQNKWITLATIVLIIGISIAVPNIKTNIFDVVGKMFFDEVAIILILRQLFVVSILNFLSYLLMRKREIVA